ncbi:MAG: hypoxanthine phosphoribosyltransferase [Coriobacteriales bacterium]
MNEDVQRVLITREQISGKVAELGARITADYQGEQLLVVSVLKGAAIFMADLVRAIDLPVEMDFMAVSSYGSSHESSGVVRVIKDLNTPVEGRHVLIAEDVLDSGLTLNYVVKMLKSRNPKSIEVAAFLVKEGAQKAAVECKYTGFACPDEYLVGYGLDYAERYRNLPYVGVLDPRVYLA